MYFFDFFTSHLPLRFSHFALTSAFFAFAFYHFAFVASFFTLRIHFRVSSLRIYRFVFRTSHLLPASRSSRYACSRFVLRCYAISSCLRRFVFLTVPKRQPPAGEAVFLLLLCRLDCREKFLIALERRELRICLFDFFCTAEQETCLARLNHTEVVVAVTACNGLVAD